MSLNAKVAGLLQGGERKGNYLLVRVIERAMEQACHAGLDKTTAKTISHLTDRTTSHSTRLPKDNTKWLVITQQNTPETALGTDHGFLRENRSKKNGHYDVPDLTEAQPT